LSLLSFNHARFRQSFLVMPFLSNTHVVFLSLLSYLLQKPDPENPKDPVFERLLPLYTQASDEHFQPARETILRDALVILHTVCSATVAM
jgi:hypothetical protein